MVTFMLSSQYFVFCGCIPTRGFQLPAFRNICAANVVVFDSLHDIDPLQVLRAGTKDRVVPKAFKIFKPVDQRTNISATFPDIASKTYVGKRPPAVQDLLAYEGQFVGIQVESL